MHHETKFVWNESSDQTISTYARTVELLWVDEMGQGSLDDNDYDLRFDYAERRGRIWQKMIT